MKGKPVVCPILYSTLTPKEKKEALEAINSRLCESTFVDIESNNVVTDEETSEDESEKTENQHDIVSSDEYSDSSNEDYEENSLFPNDSDSEESIIYTGGVDNSLIDRLDQLENEIKDDIIESEQFLNSDIDSTSDDSIITNVIRPKRVNTGKGIDRTEMSFNNKSYDTSKQVQLLMKAAEKSLSPNRSYMSRAVNVLFTQMAATKGTKKYGEKPLLF